MSADRVTRWMLLIIASGILLRLGVLSVGLVSDDYMQYGMLEGIYPGEHAVWDLYSFVRATPEEFAAHRELGTLPWWTIPELHGSVMRPLSSLTLAFDHALGPRATGLHHLHSLGWWAFALCMAGLLLRRAVPPAIALAALAFLAYDDGIVTCLSWLANRCVLACAAFSWLSLWGYLRWRGGWRPGRWVALAGVSLALASGEYGLITAAYVLAYEFVAGKGSLASKLRHGAWVGVPALVYLGIHQWMGYGTIGAEVYADPFDAPLNFLLHAADRVPRMAAELGISLPSATSDLVERVHPRSWIPGLSETSDWNALRRAHLALAAAGLALLGGLAWLARGLLLASEREAIAWLLLGSAIGLIPVAVAPAHSRLLVLSQLGACAGLGALLVAAGRALRSPSTSTVVRAGMGTGMLLLLPIHFLADPWWGHEYTERLRDGDAQVRASFRHLAETGTDVTDRDVVLVAGRGQSMSIHGTLVSHFLELPVPRSWQVLSMAHAPLSVRRTGGRTLELSLIRGNWFDTPAERFFRAELPIPVGEVIRGGGLAATVREADAQRRPLRIEFVFDHDLDDPRYRFVVATRRGLEPFDLPAVGGVGVAPLPRLPKLPRD